MLSNFLETLKSSRSKREVWDALLVYARQHGVDALNYQLFPQAGAFDVPEKAFVSVGFDDSYEEKLKAKLNVYRDIFISRDNEFIEPMIWADIFENFSLTEEQKKKLLSCSAEDLTHVMVFPVFGPNGRGGAVMMRFSAQAWPSSVDNIFQLHFAAMKSHIHCCRMVNQAVDETTALTDREREVLTWVARGKSNTVIADIVGISAHTVNGYLRRVYLKTQTSCRTTAALRAVAEGLIDI